jgi:hypothetical protein
MLNPFKEINWDPGLADRRKFAKSLIIGFPCLAVLLILATWFRSGVWNFRPSLLLGCIGLGVGLALLALPSIAKPFYLVWYFISACIGAVVGNALLVVLFYVVVTGIAVLKRAFGKSSFRKTMDKQAKSYWHDAGRPDDPELYYRQF